MRFMLVGATATMALLGAGTIGYAQAPDDRGKGPAAEDKAQQTPGKTQQAPGDSKAQPRAGAEGGKEQPKAAQQPTTAPKDQPKAALQQPATQPKSTNGQQKATQERTTDRPKGAEGPKSDADKKQKSTEQQQPADHSNDTAKRTENPDQGKGPKATEGPQRDTDKQQSTQDRGRDQTKSAEQPKQGERLKITEQQRTTVRERLTKTRVEKTRINVNINIGTAIPRSVRLHTVPVAILSIAPEYRGYSYIVLEDETIVIINPRTYVIVDFIPVGTQRADRPGRSHITLSSDQMRFVSRSVPRDRTAEVRARLALGAEITWDVELLVFPGDVVRRIPDLDRYRYVVSGGEVIIVDPSDREVVLVIDE